MRDDQSVELIQALRLGLYTLGSYNLCVWVYILWVHTNSALGFIYPGFIQSLHLGLYTLGSYNLCTWVNILWIHASSVFCLRYSVFGLRSSEA